MLVPIIVSTSQGNAKNNAINVDKSIDSFNNWFFGFLENLLYNNVTMIIMIICLLLAITSIMVDLKKEKKKLTPSTYVLIFWAIISIVVLLFSK